MLGYEKSTLEKQSLSEVKMVQSSAKKLRKYLNCGAISE